MEAVTLYELNSRVKQALKKSFAETLWITAEITEIQINSSGHCYLQLADKKEEDESIVATARGTIWAFVFRTLRPYFETSTGRSLAKGMKVMLLVEVVFHEVYGFSLNVKDIDPTYTVGDLERKKREILLQLEQDGIINMNRELEFPLLPKNVAVISSPTAAGFGDFMNHLEKNPYGYRFHVKLFSAIMQGEKTTDSVIAALDRIYEYESFFDVVVIIRGGGAQTDLGCFDSYDMAANIAQFPLPVISGIGHERDETIVDRVAHMRVKTPTAAAAFLIDVFHGQEGILGELQNAFVSGVQHLLHDQQTRQLKLVSEYKRTVQTLLYQNITHLKLLSQRLQHAFDFYVNSCQGKFVAFRTVLENRVTLILERQKNRTEGSDEKLRQKVNQILANYRHHLEMVTATVKLVDPKSVLERGYSITRMNGKALKDMDDLKPGDLIETEIAKGIVVSEVKNKK